MNTNSYAKKPRLLQASKEEIFRKKEAAEQKIVEAMNEFVTETGFEIQSIDFDWEHKREFGSKKINNTLKRVILHVGRDNG